MPVGLAIGASLVACAAPPSDPWVVGGREMARGNLLGALQCFDRVPPSHAEYASARTTAKAVERRMRMAQRLLLEGFSHRAQWRDDEAEVAFENAARVWPALDVATGLLAATRARQDSLRVRHDDEESSPAITAIETSPILDDALGGESTSPPAAPPGSVPPTPSSPGPAELETALGRVLADGDLDSAILLLRDAIEAISRPGPSVRRTALERRLVSLLSRRALRRYGQGDLELALVDWHEVASVEPLKSGVVGFVRAAEVELELRRAP